MFHKTSPTIDTLLRHPRIYLDAGGHVTTALLIRDGQIAAVGEAAERAVVGVRGRDAEVVEPEGACVFPALCDAHIHLWGVGMRHGTVDLSTARSAADVYRLLGAADPDGGPGGWVIGRDWDDNRWDDGAPLDIARLDALFPARPVALRRLDGHAMWVNRVALQRAGIRDNWNPGPNGHVGRDAAGRPTGLLVDDAEVPVRAAIPPCSVDEDREVFLASCAMLRTFGCASAHVAWVPTDRLQMLTDLADRGELPLRLHCLVDGRADDLDALLAAGPRRDPWLNIAGVKYFADGAMGSRGARMFLPYPDGSHGLAVESRDQLVERCAHHAALGWQVAVHAIGDATARDVLDAFAAIPAAARGATRPRIEHCQTLHPDDIPRFGALGVTASIQAIHLHSDATWAADQLDDAMLDRLFRWRDLHDATPHLIGGSDFPIDDPNPWHGIATASARRDRNGRAFRPDQRLSRTEALRSYTEGAAWSAFRETTCGRLDVGFAADLVVLDRDVLSVSDDDLWDTQALELRIAGQRSS